METNKNFISVFTDGSCNPVRGIGGWAAIVFVEGKKIILSGSTHETSHQRMELYAAIHAVEYLQTVSLVDRDISIFTDSQYLVNLQQRKDKLLSSGLTTKRKISVPNADLVEQLLDYLNRLPLKFVKVKSHEKTSGEENFNREVDKLSRKIVRDSVRS